MGDHAQEQEDEAALGGLSVVTGPAVDNGVARLRRVPLREVWLREASDFTTWLEQNLDVLNEHLEVQLESAEREQSAGSFSVDLVAEDENGQSVVIENQLEKTDHDHLGKLLTYLAAFDAERAIWITADPRPEHVKAVAWLNDSSPAEFHLFKVEAVRIGTSPPAPLLTPIVGPSAEGKRVAQSKKEKGERHRGRVDYWAQLLELASGRTRLHSNVAPKSGPFLSTGAGVSGLSYSYWVRKHDARLQFWIDRGPGTAEENRAIFDQLHARRNEIESDFGGSLFWNAAEGDQSCRIIAEVPTAPGWVDEPEDREPGLLDLIDAMVRFEAALAPRVKSLRLNTAE